MRPCRVCLAVLPGQFRLRAPADRRLPRDRDLPADPPDLFHLPVPALLPALKDLAPLPVPPVLAVPPDPFHLPDPAVPLALPDLALPPDPDRLAVLEDLLRLPDPAPRPVPRGLELP